MKRDDRFVREEKVVGYCPPCDKIRYLSRKAAKAFIRKRLHGGAGMNAYRCPRLPQFWHVGHLAPAVVAGEQTRDEYYRSRARHSKGKQMTMTDLPDTDSLTMNNPGVDPEVALAALVSEGNDQTAVLAVLLSDLSTYRYVTQIPIGPALARRLIDLNADNNRLHKPKLSGRYARDMKTTGADGKPRWRERTGQTVKIATDGFLVDGLHRMHAIVLSGRTYKFDLCFGVDRSDMPVIDAGSARTTADTIRIAGGGDISRVGPIVKNMIAWEGGSPMGPNGSTVATPLEVAERYDRDALLFEAAAKRGMDCHNRNVGTASATGTAYFALVAHNPSTKMLVDDFYDQLISGVYPVKDPTRYAVYRLREKLLGRRADKLNRGEMTALVIRAWNRWNTLDPEGRRITVDRLPAGRRAPGSSQIELLSNANFPTIKSVPKRILDREFIADPSTLT